MLRALVAVFVVAIMPLRLLEAQAASMRVTIPSPTAASLGRFGDVPVSLYSGVPDVTIPIFAVQGRTLQLPITLKYQGGGTRVEEIGGWAGIGMALEAGGVVTRSVRGIPDDKAAGYFNTGSVFLTDANWFTPSTSLIDNLRNGTVDGEPDQFFFSFAGISGQFALGPVSGGGVQYRSIPYRKLRIVPTFGDGISGWTITTEDGTRYTFAAVETHTDYTTNSTGAINPNLGQSYASSGS